MKKPPVPVREGGSARCFQNLRISGLFLSDLSGSGLKVELRLLSNEYTHSTVKMQENFLEISVIQNKLTEALCFVDYGWTALDFQ